MRNTRKLATIAVGVLISTNLLAVSAFADNENSGSSENITQKALKSCNSKGAQISHDDEENSNKKHSTVVRDAQKVQKSLKAKNTPAATAALTVLTTAIATYETSTAKVVVTFNAAKVANDLACKNAITPLQTTLNTALATAKTTLNAVLTNVASTPLQKSTAKTAYKTATTAANTAFTTAAKPILAKNLTDSTAARLALTNAQSAAELLLKSAITTARLAL